MGREEQVNTVKPFDARENSIGKQVVVVLFSPHTTYTVAVSTSVLLKMLRGCGALSKPSSKTRVGLAGYAEGTQLNLAQR